MPDKRTIISRELHAPLTDDQWSDLIEPICTIAGLPISKDEALNALIRAAIKIKEREGFAVVSYPL